jgi:hypothetical protein
MIEFFIECAKTYGIGEDKPKGKKGEKEDFTRGSNVEQPREAGRGGRGKKIKNHSCEIPWQKMKKKVPLHDAPRHETLCP